MKAANQSSCIDILAHDDALTYQAWLWKVQQLRRFNPDERSLEFWTLPVTLTLTTQSNPFFSQNNPTHDVVPSNQVQSQKDQQFRRYIRKSYFDYMTLTVTLTLKTANQSFWKVIWLMMMHRDTTFGSKRLSGSEDVIWTNIHWYFEVLLWPWPWTVIHFFERTLWLMMLYSKIKFGSKQPRSLENIVETVGFWSYKPLLWPWPWR